MKVLSALTVDEGPSVKEKRTGGRHPRVFSYTFAKHSISKERSQMAALGTDRTIAFLKAIGIVPDPQTVATVHTFLHELDSSDISTHAAETHTHGVTGDIVGTGGVQTLTNKTLVAVAGTVAAPSVAVGAADTGLYLISGTSTGFSQDGVLKLRISSTGINVDSVRALTAIGTTPVGTVSITEYGDGRDYTTQLTLTNFIIGTLPGVGAALGVGNIIYTFPAGQHFEMTYSFSSIVLTVNGTAVATDTGLGSVIASGAIATLDGTSTFEDRLTGQTINTDPAGGAAVSALKAATAGIGTGISLNVEASVKNVFLNSAGTWNADNLGNLTATGTIVLKWTRM